VMQCVAVLLQYVSKRNAQRKEDCCGVL